MYVVHECPWCLFSVPETTRCEPGPSVDGGWSVKVIRTAWETYMVDHWRDVHPDQAEAWGGPLLAEMGDDVRAQAAWLTDTLTNPPD